MMGTQKYEVQGPDGATYEVEAPEGVTQAMIVAQVAKAAGQPVDLTDFGLSDAEAAAVASGKPPRRPNTTLENISSGAGEVLDGILPGAGNFMAGVGGAIGNTIAAPLSDKVDWDPLGSFKDEQDAAAGSKQQFEVEHPDLADGLWGAGLVGSLALPQAQVFRGSGMATGAGNAAINGAGYGALSGLLNDSGDGRIANAALGASFGGVVGAAAPAVLNRLGETANMALRNVPGMNAALTAVGNAGRRLVGREAIPATAQAHAQAERLIGRAMEGGTIDGGMGIGSIPLSPDSVEAEVLRRQALGVPAMPADVAEPLRGTFRTAAVRGEGRMATRARGAVDARQAQQAARIRGHLGTELGPAVDPIQEAETISRRASAAADPDYRRAYAQGSPMVIDEDLQAIMRRPAFQRAIPQAYDNILNRGGNPEALGFVVGPNGITLSPQPNFEAFDQVVRTLNKGMKRSELTGRPILDNESGAINDVMMDLDGHLKRSNSAYADAKGNFADEMAIKDALRRGQDVSNLTGDEIASQLRTMPQHAQEAWMAGARTSLANDATQAGLKPTANVAQRTRQSIGLSGAGLAASLGDSRKQRALETMTGRPGALRRLDGRLEAEDQAYRTFADVTRRVERGEAGEDTLHRAGGVLSMARKAAQGRYLGVLSDVVLRGNPKGTAAFRRDLNDHAAGILSAADPASVREAMSTVRKRRGSDEARQGVLSAAAFTLARPGILQAAGQSTDPYVSATAGEYEPSQWLP